MKKVVERGIPNDLTYEKILKKENRNLIWQRRRNNPWSNQKNTLQNQKNRENFHLELFSNNTIVLYKIILATPMDQKSKSLYIFKFKLSNTTFNLLKSNAQLNLWMASQFALGLTCSFQKMVARWIALYWNNWKKFFQSLLEISFQCCIGESSKLIIITPIRDEWATK